jgi:uncharacterized protein YqjF (DUF2071 family)
MRGPDRHAEEVGLTAGASPDPRFPVMRQGWENLLFAHWDFDPPTIQASLPPGLTVDTFAGRAWVGVVPFRMAGVRPAFLPAVPGLSWFWELNVRTYVLDRQGRPGVWFYSLDCDQPLACATARRWFHLNYRDAEMDCQRRPDGWIEFESRWLDGRSAARLCWRPDQRPPAPAAPGTLREFLVERYRLYSYDREAGRLMSGEVAHSPYQLIEAELGELDVDGLFASNGLPPPGGGPVDLVASPGVRVRIFSVKFTS